MKPSGSMNLAMQELHDKANRAWFGISNIIFRIKRMEGDKIFNIFDSLVTPVALYGCEFWLPCVVPKKSFSSNHNLLNFWKDFLCEKINQKCARISLSVNRKTSRLAVLGELGRYPLYIKALSQCINYKMSLLGPNNQSSLISDVIKEMKLFSSRGSDCWLTRVNKIQQLLNIPDRPMFKRVQGKKVTNLVKSKFDKHWLDTLNSTGSNNSNLTGQSDHSKLRTYRTFKSSFTREPYVDLIRNRNQKSFIARLRTGSHHLNIERGRWTRPVTPVEQRICAYCKPTNNPTPRSPCSGPPPTPCVDNEYHFLMSCPRFDEVRTTAFEDIALNLSNFCGLSQKQKFSTLLCPTQAVTAKIVNRLIREMFQLREKIDNQP